MRIRLWKMHFNDLHLRFNFALLSAAQYLVTFEIEIVFIHSTLMERQIGMTSAYTCPLNKETIKTKEINFNCRLR